MFKAMKVGFGLVIGATLADMMIYAVSHTIVELRSEKEKYEDEAEA